MNRRIKLIWDFRGPDALEIAKHHCVHLKEFTEMEKLHYHEAGCDTINEMHTTAYIVVDEVNMKTYRDALKPHRGLLA